MKTDQLDYELPAELIAQDPAAVRSDSRLLVLDRSTGALTDSRFRCLGEFLRAGDCLVLNDTKVLPARFFARRRTGGNPSQSSGGALEGLFLREVPATGASHVIASEAKGPPNAEVRVWEPKQSQSPGSRLLPLTPQGQNCCAAPEELTASGAMSTALRRQAGPVRNTCLRGVGMAPTTGVVSSTDPPRGGSATRGDIAEQSARAWEVMLKGARKVKLGESIAIENREQREFCLAKLIEKRADGVCLLEVQAQADAEAVLNEVGFPPLPPYIHRDHDLARAESDLRRYQTVYARCPGAVAAPTAGLHFTDELMAQLKAAGIAFAYVTLHVGAGTFKPIATEQVEEHEIHHEWYRLDTANAEALGAARQRGGRIIAVGTTVTRVLETVAQNGGITPCEGMTNLFITPGYEFKVVNAMITNFHLPRSTLLALVGAFAGLERTLAAYRHAVEQRYRFYSYGDAMLIA
jgi:S-adenosylmethionine:tRNA ribosyltransferase-isomerase